MLLFALNGHSGLLLSQYLFLNQSLGVDGCISSSPVLYFLVDLAETEREALDEVLYRLF
jgi:hypothetical protein